MILLKKLGYTFTTLPHLSANREIQKSFKKSKKRGEYCIIYSYNFKKKFLKNILQNRRIKCINVQTIDFIKEFHIRFYTFMTLIRSYGNSKKV